MATIGVKIELEGAPQYKENMSNLTAQTKLYQAQLKRLEQEMQSGASAFRKSLTESKALQQQLDAQKNQAKLLEEQIAKTSEKYGEDSTQVIRLKTQYEKLQTEISKTSQALEENGGIAGAVGAEFQEIGSKLDSVSEKIGNVGAELTKKVTAPIAAVGAASLKAFTEVDEGMDTIVKKTGATGEALEEMQNIARDMATTIPTSFETAGAAVGEVNTRFGLMGDELSDLSTKFVQFADLNGTDVSASIDSVQAAMAAFNIESSKAGDVLDILNKAGQDSGISMDTLSNSLLTNAASLTEMGFGLESAAGLIANLEKNGVDSSAAMAGLKKAFANATADGKTMEEALAELESTMQSADSNTEAYQAALDLFGNKAGPQLAKAIQEGRLSLDEASNAVTDYGDSVSKTFEATQDPVDQFTVNMNKLKLVGEDIVNSSAPLITDAMEKMAEVIQGISDKWNSLNDGQKEAVIQFALVAAAIGPVISAISGVIGTISTISSTIGSFVGFLPTIGAALSGVGAVITGTILPAIGAAVTAIIPVLPIIAAVAAAIAAVILVVKNWGAITDWISEKWATLTAFLSEKTAEIQTFFTEHLGIIGELIATKIEIIKTIITTVVAVIQTIFTAFGETIKAITEGDWSRIGEIWSNAWAKIQMIIAQAIVKIVKSVMDLGSKVKESFMNIINSAKEWGSHLLQNFIDGIMAKWEALKQTVANVAQTVNDFLGFTEPKKGPMSSFNDWPIHMMENYSHGIENAKYLVKNAVADVAADVSVLQSPLDSAELYEAVRAGASNAAISFAIGDREFTRALRDMGVQFNG
jgi:TP901 family phage tail tape measure protein